MTKGAIKIDPIPKTAPPTAPARVACKMSIPPRSTCLWRRTALPMVPERTENARYEHSWIYQGAFWFPSSSRVVGMHCASIPRTKIDIKPPTAPM